MTIEPPRRLLLMGKHSLLFQGLVRLLHDRTAAEIRTTVSAEEMLSLAQSWNPDAVIIESSNVSAAAPALTRLREAARHVPVLIIAPNEWDQFIGALHYGARGFVGHDATDDQLLACLDAVRRGEWGLPRKQVAHVIERFLASEAREHISGLEILTAQDVAALRLLAQGTNTERLARSLHLSTSAARILIRSIEQKLGVANRVQAVSEAHRRGLLNDQA